MNAPTINIQIKVLVICPLCEKRGEILVPDEVIHENKGTSTVLIHAGVICNHSYQVFLDKKYKVRGYQRNDYEISDAQQQQEPASELFTSQANSDFTPQSKTNKFLEPDPQIIVAIRDFMKCIDEFPYVGTCAQKIAELHSFIQSLRGFHPLLPDMKNWINQLRVGAIWDEKTKGLVKKRAIFWLEKAINA